MGGGDLNLKKSWHPNTMRNMEKVWKAEQRDNEERKRIAELQREIVAERSREDMQRFAESSGVVEKKDNTKLDWMYKGPSGIVDREEYLLGRTVDKTFEQLEQSEQQGKALSSRKNAVERGDECLPNSIRFASDQQVDLARKMMEDPLLAIKNKEVESRQQLLSNPVKLKQLKQLVEMQSKKKKQKKEKREKKDKKKKKKKSSRTKDSNFDSDDDSKLNALLAKKLNSLKNAGLLKGFADDVLIHKAKKHKKSKDKDSDSDSDNREARNSSSIHKKSVSKDCDLSIRHIKRESSPSSERYNDRKKMAKRDYDESRRNSNKIKDAPEVNQRYKGDYRSDNQGNQKYRNLHFDEDKQRAIKREKDRKGYSPARPLKSRRSPSKSPDDGRKQHRGEVNRRRRMPSPDGKSRKRRDSGSSLDLDSRDRNKTVDKGSKNRKRRDSASSLDLDDRNQKGSKLKKPSKKQESSSSDDSDSSSGSSSENDSPRKRPVRRGSDSEERRLPKFGLMLPDGSKPVPKPAVKVKEERRHDESEKPKWTKPERRKLDEKEIEARRREMMDNSNWREKERERNKRRREMEIEEEKRQQANKFDEDFARKQFVHVVSHSTVEGRIKSNISNIQRSKMAMDKNFARR